MSLLNSHKNASINDQGLSASNSADWKRQFIQDQLEVVRKQKEQLLKQQTNNTSHQANRSARHSSGVNLHELSTIKEVDTPKSERNLKLNSSANANRNSNVIFFFRYYYFCPYFFNAKLDFLWHLLITYSVVFIISLTTFYSKKRAQTSLICKKCHRHWPQRIAA